MNEILGYIKLFRKLEYTEIWADPFKVKLWLLILFRCSYEDKKILVGSNVIDLKAGQCIVGRNELEANFNIEQQNKHFISGSTLYRYLEIFEKLEMLHITKSNKYSLITVLNWSSYQTSCTTSEHQLHNNCTTSEHQLHTNKEVKEVKEVKKIGGIKRTKFVKPTQEEIISFILENNLQVNAEVFFNYYESNGWKVGKNSMKDWKATVRQWNARDKNNKSNKKVDVLPSYYTGERNSNANVEFDPNDFKAIPNE